MPVILVNERQGYRVCLECDEVLADDDERAWMSRHAACRPTPEPSSSE
jgi:hypothetical protein